MFEYAGTERTLTCGVDVTTFLFSDRQRHVVFATSQDGFTGSLWEAGDKITTRRSMATDELSRRLWEALDRKMQRGFTDIAFGAAPTFPFPPIMTGDGRAEIAVYRAGLVYAQIREHNFRHCVCLRRTKQFPRLRRRRQADIEVLSGTDSGICWKA